MRKNKYDDKFNATYRIRRISNTKVSGNDIENESNVRIIRHTDQNTFTTKIATSGIEHEQSTENFIISPLHKSSKTKISKLLLKSQVKTTSAISSNKSSKNISNNNNRPTKAIVKSITTYKVDPYLFHRKRQCRETMNTDSRGVSDNEIVINNDELTAAPVSTFVTKDAEMQINDAVPSMTKHDLAITASDKYLSRDLSNVVVARDNETMMMKGGDVVIAIDDVDDKESTSKPPVAQPYVNYQFSFDDREKFIQKSVDDDHEMNRNVLINTINKPAGDACDEEMSPIHSLVINKSLNAVATTTDNSSKKSFAVMHNNNGNVDDDREKENYHDNGNPQLSIEKSPYELTQQTNFKSMNLNLSPATATTTTKHKKSSNFHNNTNKSTSPVVICPKLLKTSLGSGATNVTTGSIVSHNIQMSPIRQRGSSITTNTPITIDREAAREFIKKQQEQRKALEIEKKKNNEKVLIKQRLEALKKRTRNLVQHNVEKKHSKKGGFDKKPLTQETERKEDLHQNTQELNKVRTGLIKKERKISKSSDLPPKKVPVLSKSVHDPQTMSKIEQIERKKVAKRTDQGIVQPKDLIKTSQSLGILRNSEIEIQDDIYSPLQMHDATVVGDPRESMGQTFINRSYNQTIADYTMDPNATSFMIHENSRDESQINESKRLEKSRKDSYKVPFNASVQETKQQMPVWLQETNVQQFPYNFITALKKKLTAAVEETKSPIKNADKWKSDKYHRMGFVNDQREYESCSFTEIISDSHQENIIKESQKGILETVRGKENTPDQSVNEQYTSISSISSPLQNFSPNHLIFSSKYKHQHKHDTVTDPNTISEITSLRSEIPQQPITTKNQSNENNQRQVEGGTQTTVITKRDINPMLDPIPLYDANGNENQRNNRYLTINKNVNDAPPHLQQRTKMSSSQKIDNEIVPLSDKKSNDDKQLDETYARLLLEFKQSLNNFIDLNQKLQSAKQQAQQVLHSKPQKSVPSSSHPITTRDDIDRQISSNLSPLSKNPSKIEETARTDENMKPEIVASTKYSSSFESPVISTAKNPVERISSSSSSNSTGYDRSSDKTKSDFYEPQRFEKEFGDELRSHSEKSESQRGSSEKSVEEIIPESSLTHETSSKSVPIIRDNVQEDKNKTGTSIKRDESLSSASSGKVSQTISHVTPKITSENQSTSAGDDSSRTKTSLTEVSKQKETRDDPTDTEIESLPVDNKYESEFETEATESLVESSILEMSFNESNLNFSYSTVGMVDQMIYTEEMKNEQMSALIGVRTKSVIDRLKGQISFLEVKKQRCKESKEVQSIRKKQRAILMKLEQAKDSLKKIVETDGRNVLQPISHSNNNFNRHQQSNYLQLFEKILKSRMKVPSSTTKTSKKPIKGFEIEPSYVLERLLEKRQRDLEVRKQKLEKLSEWQQQLDEEERKIIEMEQQLLKQNIVEAQGGSVSTLEGTEDTSDASKSEKRLKSRAIEDQKSENKENVMTVKLSQIENSLSILQEVSDTDDNVVLTGVKLNKLWFRLSGQKEKKFDPYRVYNLNKRKVSELYEEAKNVVVSQFEDKNRVKQMLEVSKLQETVSESVHEPQKEGSSTTEASSVLDKDEINKNKPPLEEVSVPETTPVEADMTLTEENVQKLDSLNKDTLNKSSTTPVSIEEEVMPEMSSTVNGVDKALVMSENDYSYSDTFNNTEASPPEHEETFLDNISFPKYDTITFHNETFIEKSDENGETVNESVHNVLDQGTDTSSTKDQEIPEEAVTGTHSASTSSSSTISSKMDDLASESDEQLIMAAISTVKVTPKVSSTSSVSLEYKLPDIINEAEVLRRQQMQIEQEIEQLQQQVPFVYLRDIPNKPPPPYTMHLQESKDKFPSPSTISSLVMKRVEKLYQVYKRSRNAVAIVEEPPIDETLNIYERLIIDVSEEFFFAFEKCASSEKQTGIIKNSLVFYNPPNELECLQTFITKKVEKICDPLARDETLTLTSLDEFSLLPTTSYYPGRQNHKKDLVDEILMQELLEDDPNWSYFEPEEMIVKNDLVNGVLRMLVEEAVTELVQIINY